MIFRPYSYYNRTGGNDFQALQLTQLLFFGGNERRRRAIQVQVHQRLRCCIRLPQQNFALNGYNLFAPPPYR